MIESLWSKFYEVEEEAAELQELDNFLYIFPTSVEGQVAEWIDGKSTAVSSVDKSLTWIL